MGQLEKRDSEVEAATIKAEQADQKLLALEEAKQELSAAVEKANETVSAEIYCPLCSFSDTGVCNRQRMLWRRMTLLERMWRLCKVL